MDQTISGTGRGPVVFFYRCPANICWSSWTVAVDGRTPKSFFRTR